MSFIWTEGRVDALKTLWAAGKSGGEISEAFGYEVSRSAICGKVHRLKLPSRGPSGADRSRKSLAPSAGAISAPKKRPATQPRSMKVATPKPKLVVDAESVVPIVELTQAVGARLVPFIEIGPGECRFVVEDRPAIMCGAPVRHPGEAWCRYHRSLVYVPASDRKREVRRISAFASEMTRAAPVVVARGW